jgi:putative Mg2+ transporter-C (MgtC) family protein
MNLEAMWRILIAAGLGACVGLEREAAEQPAGLRTHVSVAIGAALFGVVSTLGFEEFYATRDSTNVQVDVTRVASQVVVGIGFIGAGMIFRQRGEVRNLTTAASLWVVAAIGLAAGVGNPGAAGITTAVLIGGLVLLRPVRAFVQHKAVRHHRTLVIRLPPGAEPGAIVATLATEPGLDVHSVIIGKEDGAPVMRTEIIYRSDFDVTALLARLARRDDVVGLSDVAE